MKHRLNVLVWRYPLEIAEYEPELYSWVHVKLLNNYLSKLSSPKLEIVFYIPEALSFNFATFPKHTKEFIGDVELSSPEALKTAADSADADIIFYSQKVLDVEALNLENRVITSELREMLEAIEIFVRGFEIPWSFEFPTLHQPWTTFYHLCMKSTFQPLILLHNFFNKNASPVTAEFVRTLTYNALANICFSRDRFSFYELQKRCTRRHNWKPNTFAFERSYALTNFYLLASSALDQLMLAVNSGLELGISDRRVGFGHSYKDFKKALNSKNSTIHNMLNTGHAKHLVNMFDLLRNHAAHRGSLLPTTIYETPEKEPSNEILDATIHEMGWDEDYKFMPSDEMRQWAIDLNRVKAQMELYHVSASDVLVIDRDGKRYIVNPNPTRDCQFLLELVHSILDELAKSISTN